MKELVERVVAMVAQDAENCVAWVRSRGQVPRKRSSTTPYVALWNRGSDTLDAPLEWVWVINSSTWQGVAQGAWCSSIQEAAVSLGEFLGREEHAALVGWLVEKIGRSFMEPRAEGDRPWLV